MTIIHAFVTSKLDYFSMLYVRLSLITAQKLQIVANTIIAQSSRGKSTREVILSSHSPALEFPPP